MNSFIQKSRELVVLGILALVFVFFSIIIIRILQSNGLTGLTDIATSRTLLMLIIVAATVSYGGVLLNRALSSSLATPELELRFRMGREIFLVFAGICGTVVGFYFGTDGRPTSASVVSVNTSIGTDGTITALVAGGAPPYGVSLVSKDGKKKFALAADKADPARFVMSKENGICPLGAQLEISGANGASYPAVLLSYTGDQLNNNGWTATCKPATPESPAPATTGATGSLPVKQ